MNFGKYKMLYITIPRCCFVMFLMHTSRCQNLILISSFVVDSKHASKTCFLEGRPFYCFRKKKLIMLVCVHAFAYGMVYLNYQRWQSWYTYAVLLYMKDYSCDLINNILQKKVKLGCYNPLEKQHYKFIYMYLCDSIALDGEVPFL